MGLLAVNSLALFMVIITPQVLADEEYESISSLTIEHTFDGGLSPVFFKRGTVTIHSITANKAYIEHDDDLSEEDITKLKGLVSDDGVYRIRILSKQGNPPLYVQGFTKACGLYESMLSDTLTLHLDQSSSLLGVSISPTVPYCMGVQIPHRSLQQFNTTVDVVQTVPGPMPETQSYIQKMEQDRMEKAKGQQTDNRSFLAKYWMYIVPVVIIMMFANSMDPNAAQGGGGGGGGR